MEVGTRRVHIAFTLINWTTVGLRIEIKLDLLKTYSWGEKKECGEQTKTDVLQ